MASGAESQMTSRNTSRTVHPTIDEMICPPAQRMGRSPRMLAKLRRLAVLYQASNFSEAETASHLTHSLAPLLGGRCHGP